MQSTIIDHESEGRLSERSFSFDTVPVPGLSTAGTPYTRTRWIGMPKLPTNITNTVCYLYPSVEDAKEGKKFGGTGFFLAVPLFPDNPKYVFIYVVTNWHTAVRAGASVVRVNKKGGGTDIFELDPAEWHFKPKWHDLAIADVAVYYDKHEMASISSDMLMRDEEITQREVGAGEDVFMVGRFVDHDGGEVNVPAVRFGNISVMPQPVEQETGAKNLKSYVLDMHSRSGYSGSPVFVYRTLSSDLTGRLVLAPGTQFLRLLAIQWGQFPEMWETRRAPKVAANALPLKQAKGYVKGWSGMTLAIPASALLELLDMPALKKGREKAVAEIIANDPSVLTAPVAESVTASADARANDANPSHKEDFTALLGAAVKAKKPAE